MIPLELRIGYKFRNSLLLAEALTHPSLGHETKKRHFDNQRLEFLGDAVLQLIFTDELYRRFPAYTEGQMTKLRARLVSRNGLKLIACRIELGQYLLMGRGEEVSGGRERASILADAFEGLTGAMYLDSNIDTVRAFILRESDDLIEACAEDYPDSNPKGLLQETLQSLSPESPVYEILSEFGPEHQKAFDARVVWRGLNLGEGSGASKKLAETNAARAAIALKLWEKKPESKPKARPEKATRKRSPKAVKKGG